MSEGYQSWIAYVVLALFVFVVVSVSIVTVLEQLDNSRDNFVSTLQPDISDPTFGSDFMRMGALYVANGNLELAIDAYTQAIAEQPENENAWHQKGKLLNRLGQCEDAVLHYERYAERYPYSLRMAEGLEIAKNC